MVRAPKGLLFAGGLMALLVVGAGGTVWLRRKETRPGPNVAFAVQNRLKVAKKPERAALVEQACQKDLCQCALVAGRSGLDVDAHLEVLEVLAAATPSCPESADFSALHAEAVARLGDNDRARAEATPILARDPKNPFALYAMALVAHRTSQPKEAVALSGRAIDAGRGATAHLLAGLIAYSQNDLESATRHFRAVLEVEPDDLDGLFNLALVAQRSNHYTEAREGFLRVANLDPSNKNARYSLAVLAHSIGANDEANHHLAKFEAIAPGDKRVADLKAILATKPAQPASPAARPSDAVMVTAPLSSSPKGTAR